MRKWPLHPKPKQYQLLYHWIEDLAKLYGVSYHSFCKNVLKLTRQEIAELNTVLPEKAIIILSQGTGVEADDLRARDLYTVFYKLKKELAKIMEKNPEQNFWFKSA